MKTLKGDKQTKFKYFQYKYNHLWPKEWAYYMREDSVLKKRVERRKPPKSYPNYFPKIFKLEGALRRYIFNEKYKESIIPIINNWLSSFYIEPKKTAKEFDIVWKFIFTNPTAVEYLDWLKNGKINAIENWSKFDWFEAERMCGYLTRKEKKIIAQLRDEEITREERRKRYDEPAYILKSVRDAMKEQETALKNHIL